MFDVAESMSIDQDKFHDSFGFVITSQNNIHKFSIIFLVAMIATALLSIGLMIYYCSSLKNIEDPIDSHEEIINELLNKY